MRRAFLIALFVPTILASSSDCSYAAVDGQQSGATTVVTQQSVNNLPADTNPVVASGTKAETLKYAIVAQPVQVAMVDGDYHKYEALTWQNRGYSGGIKDLSINYASGDDITIDAGGSGIIGNGDYKGYYSLKNKDVGYVDVDFKQFRKYYDTYGGIYRGFSPSLSRDLYLDIGHFGIEAGITMPDLPNVSVYYNHDYKDGSKSMLDWASVTGIYPNKKIAPSWKEIHESVDTFGIKGEYTEKGYHFTGDQRWEIAQDKTLSVEPSLIVASLGSSTTPNAQVRQYFTTDTTLMTTMLGVDKWYLNDKVFTSSAYRFEHLKADQTQKRVTANSSGVITAANNPDGDGHNNQNVNSWVLNMMVSPWNCLSGTGSIKAEVSQRDGEAYYPPAAGSNLKNQADSNTYKLAEAFGLRFKAIPRTVIYSDLSFEQSQNHLDVIQSQTLGATPGARTESRDAIIDEPVVTWAVGADFQPLRFLNLTSQFRLRDKSMNFHDNPVRSKPWQGQVFLEKLNTRTIGFTQRATAKLSGWAQTSVRYLLDDTDYDTRAMWETTDSKANTLSNNFIYDISVYPMSNLSMTGSFSQLYAKTKTVQSSRKDIYTPPFTSNSSTWMLATDYQPHKKVNLNSSLFYTLANNYDDNQDTALLNYEAAYNQMGLTVSCKWDVKKDLSVTPQYGYQRYLPNERSGIGGAYDAQIVSLAITANWG